MVMEAADTNPDTTGTEKKSTRKPDNVEVMQCHCVINSRYLTNSVKLASYAVNVSLTIS